MFNGKQGKQGKQDSKITYLQNKLNRTPQEDRTLELLLAPSTREYATQIVILEEKGASRSPKETRKLELLLDPSTREHAQMIINLENKPYSELSNFEQKRLQKLYINMIAGVSSSRNPESSLTSLYSMRSMGQYNNMRISEEIAQQSQAESSPLFFNIPHEFFSDIYTAKKDTVVRHFTHISKLLVDYCLKCRVPKSSTKLLASDRMQEYIKNNTHSLFGSLIKLFALEKIQFCEENLNLITNEIKAKIQDGSLVLNSSQPLDLSSVIELSAIRHSSRDNMTARPGGR